MYLPKEANFVAFLYSNLYEAACVLQSAHDLKKIDSMVRSSKVKAIRAHSRDLS